MYHSAYAAEVAQQHLCTLHACYSNTLTAKRNYHILFTKLIKDQMVAQRLHDKHTLMCQVRRQWYEQAKYDTGTWYADAKKSLLICGRYKKMCAYTDELLDHHLHQAHYMCCQ